MKRRDAAKMWLTLALAACQAAGAAAQGYASGPGGAPGQLLPQVRGFLMQGRLAEAQYLAAQATWAQPMSVEARLAMASAYDFSGNLDGAIAAYQGVLQIAPQFPEIRTWIGQALLHKGDPASAIGWINAELAGNPNSAFTHSLAGSVYMVTGDAENRDRAFRAAISLDPGIPAKRHGHGNSFHTTRQFGRAAVDFTSASQMAPTWSAPVLSAAISYAALGQTDAAIRWFTRFLEMESAGTSADRARLEIQRLSAPGPAMAPSAQYTGIPTETMQYFAASQHNSQWCWAAAIQMVLNYNGVDIAQEQIVARTYGVDAAGNLPNWGGDFERITGNLNNWSIDNQGRAYVVSASFGHGAPPASYLLSELSARRPVIVGYASGPASAHAVIVTAASWTPSVNGPMVQTLVVRDPWPSEQNLANRGRVEYTGASLAQNMRHYWFVRTQPVAVGPTSTYQP